MNPNIKTICFDLDNTLWNLGSVIQEADSTIYQWLQENHSKVTDELSPKKIQEIKQFTFENSPDLQHRISLLRITSLKKTFMMCGYSEDDAQQASLDAFEIFLDARHNVTFFDDTLTTLEKLLPHFQLASATNGNADIKKLGLEKYFSFAISAEHLNASKPAPKIFQEIIDQAGVAAEQIVYVGDQPVDDVWGAQQLGIKTIWMNSTKTVWPGGPQADKEITELKQLVDVIGEL